MRRNQEDPIKQAWQETVQGKRSRGRQKLRWRDVVREDMRQVGAKPEDCKERGKWRRLCRAADPS